LFSPVHWGDTTLGRISKSSPTLETIATVAAIATSHENFGSPQETCV